MQTPRWHRPALLATVAFLLVALAVVAPQRTTTASPEGCPENVEASPVPEDTTTTSTSTTTIPPEETTTTLVPEETPTTSTSTTTIPPDETTTTLVPEETALTSTSTTTTAPDETTTTLVPEETPTTSTSTTTIAPEETPTTVDDALNESDEPDTAEPEAPEPIDPPCGPTVEILSAPGYVAPTVELLTSGTQSGDDDTESTDLGPAAPLADIMPAFPKSEETYTVVARVVTDHGLTADDLDVVTMCWHLAPQGSDECTTLDPRTEFVLSWQREGDNFVVGTNEQFDTNSYEDDESEVEIGTSNTEVTVTFNFRVSGAMSAADNWAVTVRAFYSEDASPSRLSGAATVEDRSVGFAWHIAPVVDTQETYSAIATGASRDVVSAVEYFANGTARATISATNFVLQPDAAMPDFEDVLALSSTLTPGLRQVTLQCGKTQAHLQIVTSADYLLEDYSLDPTTELGSMINLECRLTYGGGALRAFYNYANSVRISLTATSPQP